MKKRYILWMVSLFIGGSLQSCSEFLETQPATQISDQELFKTVDGVQTALNGVYRYIRLKNQDVEHNGVIAYNSGFDAAAKDIVVHESMGQMQLYYGHHLDPTRADGVLTREYWAYYYVIINNVNIILDRVNEAEGSDEQKLHIRGQALAIRGWAYFNLVRAYQQTYAIAKDQPAVPLYLTASAEGQPREKVSVVYEQICKDLVESISLLENYTRQYKSQINNAVAGGLLARVYLTMEEWELASDAARKARVGFPLLSNEEYQSGFNNWELSEWIWGVQQTDDQNLGNASPFTLWANQSRGDRWTFDFFFVNDKFKELFDQGDVRNQFWKREDRNLWTSDKFRDNATFRGSIVLMRASEMLLIESESLARLGRDQEAKSILWELQDQRKSARSEGEGSQLIESILLERRKELYGEGMAWWDIIRTQQSLVREGDHTRQPNMPARSWRFILQVPTGEFNANPSLLPNDQNPYDGVYQP